MIESTVSGGSMPLLPSQSAASWPAIIAGAFAAAALSLVLLALGTGLGFASVSPWPRAGISGMSLAVTAAIWLVLTQWISAALGGYMAGRLRTRWVGTHTHEVFFRDTAHGFVTWAVASVVVAATLGTGVLSSLSAVGHAATDVAAQGAKAATTGAISESNLYGIDRLLRPSDPTAAGPTQGADPKPEVARIIANVIATGNVDDADRTYLTQLVAARTGVSQADAQKRVDDLIASVEGTEAKAKAAADTARKAAAQSSIYLALSMVIGAFIASVAAALGGRLRDEHP
jgi:hypothetical protein